MAGIYRRSQYRVDGRAQQHAAMSMSLSLQRLGEKFCSRVHTGSKVKSERLKSDRVRWAKGRCEGVHRRATGSPVRGGVRAGGRPTAV